ncbi:MAG: polyhydroxyalkanoate synthesis repressor PhaR [Gammaproteobacteria bacterium]|nr:polyhydroxyalkanoate synthesis repressor PhaR [Gammaproteobacteria bacterium]
MATKAGQIRIIKKYPNRRLYDTEVSRYITVADVRELVMRGGEFKVVDANSNADITRPTLLQIIMEQEAGGEPLFTADILSKMIRFYGDSVQGVFSSYLEKSLELFVEQQSQLQRQVRNMISGNTPFELMADLTQRNLEIWRDMQRNFLKAAGVKAPPPERDKTEE